MLVYAKIRKILTRTALAAAVAVGIAGLSVPDVEAASVSANANADIVAAIGITKDTDLDFGGVVGGTAGNVVVASNGTRTCTTVTCADSGTVAAAAFSVTGGNNLGYAITLPSSLTITTGDGVGTTKQMTVDTFTSSKAGETGTLSGSGTDTFTVGAKLTIATEDVNGAYTGSFTMTVDYN